MHNKRHKFLKVLCALIVLCAIVFSTYYFNLIPKKYYTAEDFNITPIQSTVDFNHNGIDDYTDILIGARHDAENKPRYDGKYFEGGYPPDDIGVCTDLIWRAFKNAGYNLKDMVDKDISENVSLYKRVEGKPDPNIDFRRVPNLKVFFERHATPLTLDINKIEEWQPGDIVVFGETHIGIIADKRNKKGIPYLIHNAGQFMREEDALLKQPAKISGHFRFLKNH